MISILKYGIDVTTKEEGYIVVSKDNDGFIDYLFFPKTEDNMLGFFKKGAYFDINDAKRIEEHKLAIFCTSMFSIEEEHYISINSRLIGGNSADTISFWIEPVRVQLARMPKTEMFQEKLLS